MFRNILVLALTIIWTISSEAQSVLIGENPGIPDSSAIVDIQSLDKGMLVPRMNTSQRTGIANPAKGLLVYDLVEKSFFYFNGSQWLDLSTSEKDIWYQKGTIQPADSLNANIYHLGKVSIGKDTSIAMLDIHSNSDVALHIENRKDTPSFLRGLDVRINSDSSISQSGIFVDLRGNGNKVGFNSQVFYDSSTMQAGSASNYVAPFTFLTDSIQRFIYGTNNQVSGSENSYNVGTRNEIAGSGYGRARGVLNVMNGTGDSQQIGSYNYFDNIQGLGNHIGVKNVVTGDGVLYGTYQEMHGDLDSTVYGLYNEISHSGNGLHFGINQLLSGSGHGEQTGLYQVISNTGGGGHAGVFNLLNGGGNGIKYGTSNTITPDGSGTHIAGFFNAAGGANDFAAVFFAGNVVANEVGNNYDFRVESEDDENMLFLDASTNRIGIGTGEPERQLEIQGTTLVERDSEAADPHIELRETANDYSRLKFTNTLVSNYWTIAGLVKADSSGSRLNFYHPGIENVFSISGAGRAFVGHGNQSPAATFHINSKPNDDPFRVQINGNTKFRIHDDNKIVMGSNTDSVSAGNVYIHNRLGIGIATPDYRLHLPNNGNPAIGHALSSGWATYSDQRVKKNVQHLDYGLKQIMALRPVRYDHHSSTFKNGKLVLEEESQNKIGFIAQEVEEVISEIVNRPENEETMLWSMDYEKLTPVLVKAIQELATKNQTLESQLVDQTSAIQELQSQHAVSEMKQAETMALLQELLSHHVVKEANLTNDSKE